MSCQCVYIRSHWYLCYVLGRTDTTQLGECMGKECIQCIKTRLLLSICAGYYMGMCIAAPEKHLKYVHQVACFLNRQSQSTYLYRQTVTFIPKGQSGSKTVFHRTQAFRWVRLVFSGGQDTPCMSILLTSLMWFVTSCPTWPKYWVSSNTSLL